MLFTEVVGALGTSLPSAIATALTNAGAPQLAPYLSKIPPTIALFAAFLGYNPMQAMIANLPGNAGSHLSTQAVSTITSATWFPNAIAPSFMEALHIALYLNAGLAVIAALASLMRGKKMEYEHNGNTIMLSAPVPIVAAHHPADKKRELTHADNVDGSTGSAPSLQPNQTDPSRTDGKS